MRTSYVRRFRSVTVSASALMIGLTYFAGTAAASELADAAERADWSRVQTLLDESADVNAPQADGTSALIWAAYHGNTEVVGSLLGSGADANAANRYGLSAMSQAASVGNAEIVGRLLAAGADPNAAMPEGDTPLMLAARSGNLQAVSLLLEAGADVNARDDFHGETALMWAAGENHADIARTLIEHGAEIDAVSTSFDWSFFTQTGVASHLPEGGLTALMHAAREDGLDAALVLLEAGADPNAANPNGITTLRVAITNNHLDLAKALLEHGANADDGALVEAANLRTMPHVRAAKHRTDETDSLELVNLLIEHGADVHKVPETGMVKQYWTTGDPPNEPPLHIAAYGADLELMQTLADRGAEVEQSVASDGASVLMAAMGFTLEPFPGGAPRVRETEVALEAGRLALNIGTDVNAANDDGITALHMAAGKGDNELVQFLLDNGASLDVKDRSNRLPIDVAKGVPPVPKKGDPPPPPDLVIPVHETTIALLREAMAAAGVEEPEYVAPPPEAAESGEEEGEENAAG